MGGEKTCPICGKTVKNVTVQNKEITKSDIRDNKAISIFSYIGPLFIIPMVVGNKRKSVFARYHSKQGMCLLGLEIGYILCVIVLRRILRFIPIFGNIATSFLYMSMIIMPLLNVKGILTVVGKKIEFLPIINKLDFIKNFINR